MPPAQGRETYATRRALRRLTTTLLGTLALERLKSVPLPAETLRLVQNNVYLRARVVVVGPGLWLAPRLTVGSTGAPRLMGALFYRPLLEEERPSHPDPTFFMRVFLRLCGHAASMTGDCRPNTPNILKLYRALSVCVWPLGPPLADDLQALVAEFTNLGFMVGATFHDDSTCASLRFMALARGLPPDENLSELMDYWVGSMFERCLCLADYDGDAESRRISHNFCTSVMGAVKNTPYPWERLLFLRGLSLRCPGVGAPPAALVAMSEELRCAFEQLARSHCFQPPPMPAAYLTRVQDEALLAGGYRADVAHCHAKVLNRVYLRAQMASRERFYTDAFHVRHSSSWIGSDGCFAFGL